MAYSKPKLVYQELASGGAYFIPSKFLETPFVDLHFFLCFLFLIS